MTPQILRNCVESDISAYIDGELSPADESALENHVGECENCRQELNEQKLFLSAVNSSLESKESVEIPTNFTRTIVANAESNVSGLRDPQERSLAVWICSVILIVSIIAVGAESLGIFTKLWETLFAIGDFAGNFFHMAAVTIGVVLRSVSAVSRTESRIIIILGATIFVLLVYACIHYLPKIRNSK